MSQDGQTASGDRDELDRLRRLVGPSESAYEALQGDVLGARDAARRAEADAGVLRGELAEMRVALARARQDQDLFQRRREMPAGEYLIDLGREAWREVFRPRLARLARRAGLRR